mgnify:CR=1 FL=1
MKVKVLIPFHLTSANKDCVPGEVIDVTIEQLAKIRAINVNMVEEVIEVEEEEEPKKKPKKKKAKKN